MTRSATGSGPAPGVAVRAGLHDDLGYAVPLTSAPRRVVSLVPSLTEAIAVSAPGVLVGATDWCVHPEGLAVTRVRGTKNPDLEAITALAPDLVVANEEENREADVRALRARGIAVWVTDIRSVATALTSIERVLDLLAAPERDWLARARAAWGIGHAGATAQTNRAGEAKKPSRPGLTSGAGETAYPPVVATAVIAIWRRPWMFLGRETYAGDVLRRLGVANALSTHEQRYPRVDPAQLPPHDLVVLPDEPYPFAPGDGPEAFPAARTVLVDGQALTWYGPRTVQAADRLADALRDAAVPLDPRFGGSAI